MRRSTIITSSLMILALIGAIVGGRYYLSLKTLTVNYDHITSAQLYNTSKPNSTPVNISTSGQTIRLQQGTYVIKYKAATDYADGSQTVYLSEKQQTVTLRPYYSFTKLSELFRTEQAALNQVINQQIPGAASLYQIQNGQLYRYGDWYGTTLTYKGSDIFNTDTLRFILRKDASGWKLASGAPAISISHPLYPDIPRDIVVAVNRR